MMTLRVRLFSTRCIYAYIGACTPMSIGWDNCPSCEGKDNQGEVQWVGLPERLAACLAPVTDRAGLIAPQVTNGLEDLLVPGRVLIPDVEAARTYELGTFLGIRVGNQLAAMAGERMKLDGYSEIAAVWTHPSNRGRGYAQALLSAVSRMIAARGETPFLHVFSTTRRPSRCTIGWVCASAAVCM